MRLAEGQIVGVATCPNVVFVQVWPARVLEIPVRDPRVFADRIGARIAIETTEPEPVAEGQGLTHESCAAESGNAAPTRQVVATPTARQGLAQR